MWICSDPPLRWKNLLTGQRYGYLANHCMLVAVCVALIIKQWLLPQCPAEGIFFSNTALQDEDISPVIFLQYFSVILFFLLSPPFFPQRLQYVAVWIVCYYPAGDNIITTYLLSRVCKEWCCLGPQWSNSLTQGSRITHSWLGEVKHYQLEKGVNKREITHLSTHRHTQTQATPFSSR